MLWENEKSQIRKFVIREGEKTVSQRLGAKGAMGSVRDGDIVWRRVTRLSRQELAVWSKGECGQA